MALTLPTKASPFPFAALASAAFTDKAVTTFEDSASAAALVINGAEIKDEVEMVQVLAREAGLSEPTEKVAEYYSLARSLPSVNTLPELVPKLDQLDDYLAYRTFIAGHEIKGVDLALWGSIKGSVKIIGLLKNNGHPHLLRWFSFIESLPQIQQTLNNLTAAKANKARSNKTAAGFALGLQNAKEGQVVTRFPPEPSGYLHIGHAKAATLNQYFARMYKGKLIIRFDDTNPSKERTEFEDSILEDLRLLGIHGDVVTHTSDYFDKLYELALQLIKSGKAYADDTEQTQMRKERWDGIASAHRDDSIESNLGHFEEMKIGSVEGLRWCLRAKISVDDPNKALRDPVIYRCNPLPHHRTGDKWKIYPTYDFACPVVDSIEGVTHALRTNEYRDRNPQYWWMIESLGLRKVDIWDFSRLNFIYTLLSKRKLHFFVDSGLVRGWDDPRFPTVRGIRRRGLTVEALSQFMLAQGPSQAIVSLEWDSIWSLNKKVIDPVAPRHWAVSKADIVPVTIEGQSDVEIKDLPLHKKNAEVGTKQTAYAQTAFIEQEDAASFDDNEEITLMDWGNAIVTGRTYTESKKVASVTMKLHLDGDFRKTKKKITWLADLDKSHPHKPVDVVLFDHDYLITKKKLEENDDVKDFLTPVTEFRDDALADANVLKLKKGDIIQFERKGYYIVDKVRTAEDDKMEFIHIPDGRAAGIASKATGSTPVPTATPADRSSTSLVTPSTTKMYKVDPVYDLDQGLVSDTRMYKVDSVYAS